VKSKILKAVAESIQALELLKRPQALSFIERGVIAMTSCFRNGGKLLIAGNGGSLCDASHFAEELTGFFRKNRRALPAIAFNEPGHLTCVANDIGYEHVFARAVEAYGKRGDLFIGLSTSGNSLNMILAFERAKELGLTTLAFLGKGGGKLLGKADMELIIEGFETSDRIQEAHMTAIHIMIELLEDSLFYQEEEEFHKHIMEAVRG
jgi:D-sedoheptulose 7-phosphate isomerase